MRIDLESPKSIYLNVSDEVDSILKKLNCFPAEQHVSQAQDTTRKILEELQEKINEHIVALERHAEWDTFTIAFYGETNAGKSTIIETLRIMLGEQSKVDEQQTFKKLQDRHGVTEENFEALRQLILQDEGLLTRLQEELNVIVRDIDTREDDLKKELCQLRFLVAEKMKTATFWKKLLNIFQMLPEEKESNYVALKLKSIEAERTEAVERLKRQQFETQQHKTATEQKHEILEIELKNLEMLADGRIIGNGQIGRVV